MLACCHETLCNVGLLQLNLVHVVGLDLPLRSDRRSAPAAVQGIPVPRNPFKKRSPPPPQSPQNPLSNPGTASHVNNMSWLLIKPKFKFVYTLLDGLLEAHVSQ